MKSKKERRVFPRLECPKDKTCSIVGREVGGFNGELMNISRSGASFASKNHLNDKDKVDVFIRYDEIDKSIPSAVQIVWSHLRKGLYTYGGRILDINSEDKYDLLDHFYEGWKKDILEKKH